MSVSTESVGEKLRRLRKERGLTQSQLAQRAGIESQTISNLERDRYVPRGSTLQKLADALGTEARNLV